MTFHYNDIRKFTVSAEAPPIPAPPPWEEIIRKYAPWILAGILSVGLIYVAATRS